MMTRNIKPYNSGKNKLIEFLPANYDPNKQYHFIVFLGGVGQVGTDIEIIDNIELPKLLVNGLELDCVVLCYQMNNINGWYKAQYTPIRQHLDSYTNKKTVNLTGLSLGGWGTNLFLAYAEPTYFYSAGVVCGKSVALDFPQFAGLKFRAWHSDNDPTGNGFTLSGMRSYVSKLKAVGADASLIEYSGKGHGIWDEAYNPNDPNGYIQWLKSVLPPDVIPAPEPISYPVELSFDGTDIIAKSNGLTFKLEKTQI